MFKQSYLLFIGLLILKLCQIVFTERSLPKCIVDKYSKCILNKSRVLGKNEYCMDENANIYKGIGDIGKCILVGYSEPEENVFDIREISSNDGDERTGYFIKIEKDGKITELDTEGFGKLYYCSTSSECNEVNNDNIKTGYYRNSDVKNKNIPYIKCIKGSNTCEAIEIISNDCSVTEEGTIIGVENIDRSITYKFCLNGNAIPLTSYGKYFVSINKKNIFGQIHEGYVMIEISDENILKSGNII